MNPMPKSKSQAIKILEEKQEKKFNIELYSDFLYMKINIQAADEIHCTLHQSSKLPCIREYFQGSEKITADREKYQDM